MTTKTMTKPALTIPADCCQCWKCNGSGKFYSGGAVVNGKFIGKVGTCYPCQGKGYQTPADKRRTDYYYAHVYRVAL